MKTQGHELRREDASCHVVREDAAGVEMKLEVEVKHYTVLEDGDEQHDGETCEHAYVLQDKVSHLAALVIFAIAVQHLGHLDNRTKFTLDIVDFRLNKNSGTFGI